MGYQQALLVSHKRESQVGQAPTVPGGFPLPFPSNIFAIYIVKNGNPSTSPNPNPNPDDFLYLTFDILINLHKAKFNIFQRG